jgi:hypothetical protein
MFDTIARLTPPDPDHAPRTARLALLKRVLDGTLYDALPYDFHEERTAAGDYIPLRQRRPSVRYALARIIVDDSLSLTFSDGHFPRIDTQDQALRALLNATAEAINLNAVMQEAALRGSIGSCAIWLRILQGRIHLRVLESLTLTPHWNPQAPDELLAVTERYKVPGATLADLGYAIPDTLATYWFMRQFTSEEEIWYLPWPAGSDIAPVPDTQRSTCHHLGFVPLVWVRNLPGGPDGPDGIDGACTFRAGIETGIEIDYQLSQAGRGLKYSSDPTLLIREPASDGSDLIRGGGNALVVSEKGDARLLEINGTAAAAVIDYVRTLREFALESVHGNRASADRLTTAQSGRALEMMNQGLIWLADNLRVSYGGAILAVMRLILKAAQRYDLSIGGEKIPALEAIPTLRLTWPRWYPPSSEDREKDAQTLQTLTGSGLLTRTSALRGIADLYGVTDIAAELSAIKETP